jgi:hypothetical protein
MLFHLLSHRFQRLVRFFQIQIKNLFVLDSFYFSANLKDEYFSQLSINPRLLLKHTQSPFSNMAQKGKRKSIPELTTETNQSYPIIDFDQKNQELKLKTQTEISVNNKTSSQIIKCDNEKKPFALIKITDKTTKNSEIFMLANSFKCQQTLLSSLKSSFDDLIDRLNKQSSLFLVGETLKSKIMFFPLFKSVLTDETTTLMLIKMGPEFFKLLSMIHQVQAIKIRQRTERSDLPSNVISKITKRKVLKSNHFLHFITLDNGDDFILCSEIYRYLKIEQSMFHYQLKKFPALKLYDGRLIFYKLKDLKVIHHNSPSVTMMRFQDEPVQQFLDMKSIKIASKSANNQAPAAAEKDETSSSDTNVTNDNYDSESETSETLETSETSETLETPEQEESEEAVLSDVIVSEDEEETNLEPAKKRSKSNFNELFTNVPMCSHSNCDQVCNYQVKFADNTEFLFCQEHFPTISKLNYNLQIQTKPVDFKNL